ALMMSAPLLPIKPERDLYGGVLFHAGRFQRLRGYRLLRATECLAEVDVQSTDEWFGRYLPPDLLLGDPGARDAGIHVVQACIPHMTLVPVGAEQLRVYPGRREGPWSVHARERSQEEDVFTYDVEVTDAGGQVVEQWKGLRLQVLERTDPTGPWAGPLIAPYVERRLRELGSAVSVVVAMGHEDRRVRSDRAMREATGGGHTLRRRPDGRPVGDGELCVSAAHAGNLTLAVAAPGAAACDVEVAAPTRAWQDLLGPERLALARLTARETGEDLEVAATRVWAAGECLVKAGRTAATPLVLESAAQDGWVLLGAGDLTLATWAATTHDFEHPLVVAVLMRRNGCELMSTGTSWDLRRPTLSATSTT
ncbi:MAG: polyketide synthase dehydratase domain-containing protein, partial [Chloroflexota bacterium]|nr:polyketide synthase dehydratase domain-containing protein [Chloroflexota bacterium]